MSPVAIFLFSLIILSVYCEDDKPKPKPEPKDTLNPAEKTALLKFINGVTRNPKRLSWNEYEPACSWKGIICDPGQKTVLYIRLPAVSIVGKIPPESLGVLPSLRVLSLHFNGLSGDLPSDFGNLTTLARLYLDSNNFTGQLPYIDAKNLVRLNVSFNKFNSSILHPFAKFPEPYFSNNIYFCGPPTNNTCNDSYHPSPDYVIQTKHHYDIRIIVWITFASTLVLLTLLFVVRRILCCHIKHLRPLVVEVNKLVFLEADVFNKSSRLSRFNLDDLLNASAEVLGEGSVGTSYKQVVDGKELVIGEGGVGMSRRRVEEKKRIVVVKRLKDVKAKEDGFRETMDVLMNVKERNVVPLIAFYYSEFEKWLVYEYMPGDSLSARLHGSTGSRQTQFDWNQRMRIAMSAAKGLAYLHEVEVVHGNIKSSNVLLQQETNEASLSDYGLNKLFCKPSSLNRQVTGYLAPEAFKTGEVTYKSDVYSFGVLLLELLTGKTAKQASLGEEGVHFSNLVESVIWEEPKAEIFDVELGRDHYIEMLQLLQIAKDCVLIVADHRPTMHDVVKMMDEMWLRPSSDDHSMGCDETPSTDARDTPSTSTFTP